MDLSSYLVGAGQQRKFEKNKTIEQFFFQNKLRENLILKISVRISKLKFGKSRCY